ncbi:MULTISPECIES: ATP-binding protein [Rhodomicrobium]|uniref:ATP-binding protein n=1 Tax=Rhodomicrobium TaxID=1068 RepID=UPI000B4A5806|nr:MULTISPECIES: ATP-binding protein [Rhodomicrobium]
MSSAYPAMLAPPGAVKPADRLRALERDFLRSPWGGSASLYLYLSVYLALEWSSQFHAFEFLDIALWNPSPAASLVLLLTRGLTWAPLLFIAGLLSSVFVHGDPHSNLGTIASSALLALGYTVLAGLLRRSGFQLGRGGLRDVVSLLALGPAIALFTAIAACGALVLTGDIPRDRLLTAITHFWVGDTLGIVIVMPAVSAAMLLRSHFAEAGRGSLYVDIAVVAAGLALALGLMFGLPRTDDHQFFYLLFLPVIWAAVREGFSGAALAILFAQIALLTVTETVNYAATEFIGLQLLMLTLAATGLLLGASISELRHSQERAKAQQAEIGRMGRHTAAGAMGVAIAHQISQPLSTVATHIHVALSQTTGTDSQSREVVESLTIARDEMRRAMEVLGRLRGFISEGKSEPAKTDLSTLVAKLGDVLRMEARGRSVRIGFDLAPVPPVTADGIQIEQVLLNLVTNAVDAASDRADKRGRVLVATAAEGRAARIIVEDNGAGVSPEIADRLYEPFVSTKDSGMGLGLALSRQIVALHGGRLWWEPIGSEGTRFIVELPAQDEVR